MNRWDQRYGTESYVYGEAPNDFLASVASRIPMGKVLMLAEGEGRNGVHLASLGYDVTGVDASAVGLRKAEALALRRGVSLHTEVADLGAYDIESGAWDGIVSIFCHLPPELRRRVHRGVVTGLRPGGVFVLEAYTPRQLGRGTGGPPTADLMMTLDELTEELAGLTLHHARELERDVTEGTLHRGHAHVVQVVAERPPRKERRHDR